MKFKIEAVNVKPDRSYRKGSKYDPMLEQFISGKHKMVTIKVEGKDGDYVRTQVNKRIAADNLPIKASVVNGLLYLERIKKK